MSGIAVPVPSYVELDALVDVDASAVNKKPARRRRNSAEFGVNLPPAKLEFNKPPVKAQQQPQAQAQQPPNTTAATTTAAVQPQQKQPSQQIDAKQQRAAAVGVDRSTKSAQQQSTNTSLAAANGNNSSNGNMNRAPQRQQQFNVQLATNAATTSTSSMPSSASKRSKPTLDPRRPSLDRIRTKDFWMPDEVTCTARIVVNGFALLIVILVRFFCVVRLLIAATNVKRRSRRSFDDITVACVVRFSAKIARSSWPTCDCVATAWI
jgi:hypothetical protein